MIADSNVSCLGRAALLKRMHIDAIGRYYRTNTHPEWIISRDEAAQLSGAGIEIFTVFEDYGLASKLVLTKDQGKKDAESALAQARRIGQPSDSTIYFAAEGLPDGYTKTNLPGTIDYFSGVVDILKGTYNVGVYGDGTVCQGLLDAGLCRHTWLAAASTSFEGTKEFMESWRWSLVQMAPLDIEIGDLSLDINISNGDFGSFKVL